MSELNEERWSVMSERGREAAGLKYERALELFIGHWVQGCWSQRIKAVCAAN